MPNIELQGKTVSLELAFNLPPKRAVEYLQAKGVTVDFDWETASDEAKARAFTAAGVYRLDILSDMKELVTQAVEKGTPYNEFKQQMLSALASKGYIAKNEGVAPYRLKNIYRQNIQTAYQAGSYKDLDESKKYLPYWKFIAIDDARTTTVCRSLNKTILPADDPFWDKNFPPNHFGCRSNIMGMTKEQAMKEGVTSPARRTEIMENNPPAKGFDYNPGKSTLWDKNGGIDECSGFSSAFSSPICIPAEEDSKKHGYFGRPDIKDIPAAHYYESPAVIKGGKTKEDAVQILHKALGFDHNHLLEIQSPIETVKITEKSIAHIARDNRNDARERFANFIIPAIEHPFEIYMVKMKDGSIRRKYISLFKGENNVFLVININRDGSLLWTMVPPSGDKIEGFRKGWLIWAEKIQGSETEP